MLERRYVQVYTSYAQITRVMPYDVITYDVMPKLYMIFNKIITKGRQDGVTKIYIASLSSNPKLIIYESLSFKNPDLRS